MISLGCPKNLVDSEVLLGQLKDRHTIVQSIDEADAMLLNTCSFIGESREESIQTLLQLVDLKRDGNLKHIVVCGCLPQKFSDDLEREVEEIDAMIGTFDLDKISQVVDDLESKNEASSYINDSFSGDFYRVENRLPLTDVHTRYLKISEGCDHTCTFCIIPQMRGKHVSRKIDVLLEEARQMAEQGTKELILIGQDTSYFGIDTDKKKKLPELLRGLNEIEGLEWIRVLYVYPSNVDEELLKTMAECERVCNYIDIPLQHANNEVLSRMRRPMNQTKNRALIEKMRDLVPGVSIRTTFIVGFPGETDEQFEDLYQFVKEMKFDRMGAFKFSDETDAESFDLDGKVDQAVIDERHDRLMLLQQEISKERNEAIIGSELEVLIDGESDDPSYLSGRTYRDAPEIDCSIFVKNEENKLSVGDLVKVKVVDATEYDLVGELI